METDTSLSNMAINTLKHVSFATTAVPGILYWATLISSVAVLIGLNFSFGKTKISIYT